MELFAEAAKRLFGSIVVLRHGLVVNDHDNAAAARLWSARNLKAPPRCVKVRCDLYITLKIHVFSLLSGAMRHSGPTLQALIRRVAGGKVGTIARWGRRLPRPRQMLS